MSIVRIGWSGELTKEQGEILNDAFNVMGMQAAADQGLIPQSEVDAEVERLEKKYADETD